MHLAIPLAMEKLWKNCGNYGKMLTTIHLPPALYMWAGGKW